MQDFTPCMPSRKAEDSPKRPREQAAAVTVGTHPFSHCSSPREDDSIFTSQKAESSNFILSQPPRLDQGRDLILEMVDYPEKW